MTDENYCAYFRGKRLVCQFCEVPLGLWSCNMVWREYGYKKRSVMEDIKLRCPVCGMQLEVPDGFAKDISIFVEAAIK